MLNLRRRIAVIGAVSLLSLSSAALCADGDKQLALGLERSLSKLVAAGDYRAASRAAFQLASARKRLGDPAAACKALSDSLEYYRLAVAKESGVSEPSASSIMDNSDGMADIRARFGCKAG